MAEVKCCSVCNVKISKKLVCLKQRNCYTYICDSDTCKATALKKLSPSIKENIITVRTVDSEGNMSAYRIDDEETDEE
jgi:hypothetical protein